MAMSSSDFQVPGNLQAAARQEGRFPRPATLWLSGYAAAMALLGLGNILSLLLIAAHAITVAVWRRYCGGLGQSFALR